MNGSNRLEFILVCNTETEMLGAPFTLLAWEAAKWNDPDFTFTPRAPKIPFSNIQEMQDAAQFGVSLYAVVRDAVKDRCLS